MAWHDIHGSVRGPPVDDMVRHFVQRWNFARIEKNKMSLPALLPHGPWRSVTDYLLRQSMRGGVAPLRKMKEVALVLAAGDGWKHTAASRRPSALLSVEEAAMSAAKATGRLPQTATERDMLMLLRGGKEPRPVRESVLAALHREASDSRVLHTTGRRAEREAHPRATDADMDACGVVEEVASVQEEEATPVIGAASDARTKATQTSMASTGLPPTVDGATPRAAPAQLALVGTTSVGGDDAHTPPAAMTAGNSATSIPSQLSGPVLPSALFASSASAAEARALSATRGHGSGAHGDGGAAPGAAPRERRFPHSHESTRHRAIPVANSEWYCSTDWSQQWTKSSVQVLRSAGEWSVGTETESSIYHAYVHSILNAEHMIYIENQYFLSSLGWSNAE
ncbi:hypothetical protein EON68_03655, partial [archaeon]